MKNKQIYCFNCGFKNDKKNKHCKKCGQELIVSTHPICYWLFRETLDDIEGNIVSKICKLFIDFLHLHLYGLTICFALIFTALTTALNISNSSSLEKTDKQYRIFEKTEAVDDPVLDIPTIEEDLEEVEPTKTPMCEDGYTLSLDKCIKVEVVDSTSQVACQSGYTINFYDNFCYSNEYKDPIVNYYCTSSIDEYTSYYSSQVPKNTYRMESSEVSVNQMGQHMCSYSFYDNTNKLLQSANTEAISKKTCPDGMEGEYLCRFKTSTILEYSCPSTYTLTSDHRCMKRIEKNPIFK